MMLQIPGIFLTHVVPLLSRALCNWGLLFVTTSFKDTS